ncbi:hypothetical protein K491DRAFT_680147 [Lophiostoma macrostomum CBS 122681]|uniref:Uncharacterized protein n=1 Tax=Lophiostoma macrostomum CBS 122681 TaxID=1314788 RepID=A0A6A6T5U5_9PLEO|nr:hypothetical protein K491DRAFT_680147 [Lophiostoma macrostomum CBS 122681]
MGKFFTGWALWQQMTFVLACGIVATIFAGLIKLNYNNYRVKKYSKVEKGKNAQTPEMLEAQRPLSELEPKDEIPFGIRAIESGIEVDGVWISRTNTPVGSSRSSMTDIRLPRSQNNSQLELPRAIHGTSRDSSRAPSSAFDRAVSAERIPTNDSRSSSPGRENPYAPRGRPYASDPRYSNPNLTRNSTTLQALEGSSSTRYESYNPQAGSSNSGRSGRTSDESDDLNLNDRRPYEAAYLAPGHADPRTDLDLLQSHRLSHVAETGQLTPRVRRPGHSGEWASVAENMISPNEISTTNGVDYFVPQQKTPSPPPAAVASASENIPGSSSARYNYDGHSSNQARQAVPLLETYAPQAYQPRGPQYDYYEEPSQYEAPVPQNERQSQVVRKVNSGFEILRPGTFGGEPTSPEDEKPEKRQSKRLQKRRKSSGGSKTSQFVEQI